MKINSRRHHCEIFGSTEIIIIRCLAGLLLVHDVAEAIFLSFGNFEL